MRAGKDALPEGGTRIGICLASDGTHLTNGTGDLKAHPILLSLDNINSSARRRTANHGFLLIGLLPIVSFNLPKADHERAMLDRVFHFCLRNILAPLREVARNGKLMSNALGRLHNCYTVLSMYLVDHPEATRLAGVRQSVSPVTMATNKEFGDASRHPRRWFHITKETIDEIKKIAHPVHDFETFVKVSKENHLTGVYELVWDGWDHSEPAVALCYDLLHSAYKFWNDHPFVWCKNALGQQEMDMCYKCLQPRSGWKHFKKGVTRLTKTGGRDHRNMMRYMPCVMDGAVPGQFMALIRAFIESVYIAQALELSEDDITAIRQKQEEFHNLKFIVHENRYRTTLGWAIPKVSNQLNIIPTIAAIGNLLGCSTDTPEQIHVDIKRKFRSTNHKDYVPQMLLNLGRDEQLRHFDLATTLLVAGDMDKILPRQTQETVNYEDQEEETEWLDGLDTVQNLRGGKKANCTDFFKLVEALQNSDRPYKYRKRVRTFIASPFTAIHHNRDASIPCIMIEDAMEQFHLPDLKAAISEYYHIVSKSDITNLDRTSPAISRWPLHQPPEVVLDFTHIRIWFSMRVQTKSILKPGNVNKPATIFASPPPLPQERNHSTHHKNSWPVGRYDCALFINNMAEPFLGKVNLQSEHSIN
jgi:hypothetical protein